MTSTTNRQLCLGSPRWTGSSTAQADVLGAWQQATQRDGLEAACRQVEGAFALAWSGEDGSTCLAVDRFAMQTLCWRIQDGQLRFAATADELAGADAAIDDQAIFDYLFFHVIPSPRTIYRVPPGHCLKFAGGQATVSPYWIPEFTPLKSANFDGLKKEFLDLMSSAVARQLPDTHAACFLSGGTDSSTVAGMAAKANRDKVLAYSIGFDAAGYDEMAYARIAAKHFGVDHREYYVTPADLVEGIPKVAAHYDQPFGNSSALPAYYCSKLAHADGVRHILAGDGGDELFGGNSRYAKQKIFDVYADVPAVLRKGLLEPLFDNGVARSIPLIKKGASYIEQARQPMPDRLGLYNLVVRLGISKVLAPAFVSRLNLNGPRDHQRGVWAMSRTDSHLNRELAFDWRYTLGEIDIPKVRGTTQLAGLSVGFPMLDQPLVEFSMRLPDDYKLRGNRLRWFFKEALRGFLPDEIITKQKHGFGLPFGQWTSQDPALKKLARQSVDRLVDHGLIQGDFVKELFEIRLPEHPGYYGEMIWILTMLSQWLSAKAPAWRV